MLAFILVGSIIQLLLRHFYLKPQMSDCCRCWRQSWGITNSSGFIVNLCTKVLGQVREQHCHPCSHAVSMAKHTCKIQLGGLPLTLLLIFMVPRAWMLIFLVAVRVDMSYPNPNLQFNEQHSSSPRDALLHELYSFLRTLHVQTHYFAVRVTNPSLSYLFSLTLLHLWNLISILVSRCH